MIYEYFSKRSFGLTLYIIRSVNMFINKILLFEPGNMLYVVFFEEFFVFITFCTVTAIS